MSRRIRDDFEGVVYVPDQIGATLKAGDEEPEGITLGDHLFDPEPPASDVSPYDGLKVDELKAAIGTRNEGRADDAKIPATGNKADLVAALAADDQALAEA